MPDQLAVFVKPDLTRCKGRNAICPSDRQFENAGGHPLESEFRDTGPRMISCSIRSITDDESPRESRSQRCDGGVLNGIIRALRLARILTKPVSSAPGDGLSAPVRNAQYQALVTRCGLMRSTLNGFAPAQGGRQDQ